MYLVKLCFDRVNFDSNCTCQFHFVIGALVLDRLCFMTLLKICIYAHLKINITWNSASTILEPSICLCFLR